MFLLEKRLPCLQIICENNYHVTYFCSDFVFDFIFYYNRPNKRLSKLGRAKPIALFIFTFIL